MFKITPIQDLTEQAEIAETCGTCAKEGYFAYKMIDAKTGELMGFSQFEIMEDFAFISDIKCPEGFNDFEAMFILGRSTMNFIDMCGTHICKTDKNAADEKLLLAIGFKNYECDMSGMFDGSHCEGHTK